MKDGNFIFNYQYINDDISLRSFPLSLSYQLPVTWNIQKKKL
jgi:hypothetical protein